MHKKRNLFFETLNALHSKGALDNIILIGSWCHYFYRIHFKNSPEIPAVRTLDIDFLIPNPPKIKKEINIPEILKKLDFTPISDYITGYIKYAHPELELEFLTPDLGRGKSEKPYIIKKLHIKAQGLRYLNLLQSHIMKIKYGDIIVQIPEPTAYVLHKFLISYKRSKIDKKKRDLQVAKNIGEFLLKDKDQKKKLKRIFTSLPKKWQARIINSVKDNSEVLYKFLTK